MLFVCCWSWFSDAQWVGNFILYVWNVNAMQRKIPSAGASPVYSCQLYLNKSANATWHAVSHARPHRRLPSMFAVHIYKAKNNNMLTVLHQCCGPISLCFSCGYNILSTKTTVGLPCIWLPKAHYSYCNMVKVLVCGWMAQLYTVVNVLPVVKYCSSCKQFLHLLNTCLVF